MNNNLPKPTRIIPISKSWSPLCKCVCCGIFGEIFRLSPSYRLLSNQRAGLYIQEVSQ